jgi:predicted Zn-dependent peptidase
VTGNATDDDLSYLLELIGNYSLEVSDGSEHNNIAPVPERFGKRVPEVKIKNADFTMVRYSFDVDMNSVSSAELDLLYELVLGGYSSDFFIELSEKRGLFYDLNGAVERYKNIAEFYFSYELKPSKLYEAVEKTVELLRSYGTELPSVKAMRASFVDNAYMLLDDSRELNFTFGYDNHVLGLGYSGIEDRRAAYAAITPERIRDVAREVFRPENMTVAIKCNKKKTDTEKLNSIIFGGNNYGF